MTAVRADLAIDDPPTLSPRRRGFWADARFLLGIVLIVASICGVWAVLALARQTSPVYAAARTLVAGEPVTADDLTPVDVGLGAVGDAYLASGADLTEAVAARTVHAGELVPASAVIPEAKAATTTVVVRSSIDVPSAVRTGSAVELWVAAQTARGVYEPPRILIPDATVASVTREDSVIGGGAAALELVIPRADVAATLQAIAAESALSVIPVGGVR